jgi:DNA invertase Pin-like site-specific DNA recombinase
MKKAYEYRRISTSEQSNFSISGQGNVNSRYAAQHGIEIIQTFEDDGVSGATFNRPGWKALMKALKTKEAEFVIVCKYDRLGRNVVEALSYLAEIESKNNVRVLSAMEHFHIDPTSPFYFKMRADILVNADFERRVIRDRTNFGIWNGRSEGRHLSTAPFGYLNKRDDKNKPIIVADPDRSIIVQQIFSDFLRGLNLTEVKQRANKIGFTLQGRSSIQRVLTNPTYAGFIVVPAYQKEPPKTIRGIHEPIISEIDYLRSQELLYGKTQKHSADQPDVYLRGWLLCGNCGKAVTGSRSKGRNEKYFWYYRCNYCKQATSYNVTKVESDLCEILRQFIIPTQYIDELIEETIKIDMEQNKSNETIIKAVEKEIKASREKLDSLEDKFIRDLIEEVTYKKWKPKYLQELHLNLRKLEELTTDKSGLIAEILAHREWLEDIGKMFENSDIQTKKGILKLCFNNGLHIFKTHYATTFINPIFTYNNQVFNNLKIIEKPENMTFSGLNYVSTLFDAITQLKKLLHS